MRNRAESVSLMNTHCNTGSNIKAEGTIVQGSGWDVKITLKTIS